MNIPLSSTNPENEILYLNKNIFVRSFLLYLDILSYLNKI